MIVQGNRHGAQRIGEPSGEPVTLHFEGKSIAAFSGDSIASALLAAGVRVFTISGFGGEPRGGFCFTGRCADCLVVVDGRANQRACITPVRDGMDVRIQHGHGSIAREVRA